MSKRKLKNVLNHVMCQKFHLNKVRTIHSTSDIFGSFAWEILLFYTTSSIKAMLFSIIKLCVNFIMFSVLQLSWIIQLIRAYF